MLVLGRGMPCAVDIATGVGEEKVEDGNNDTDGDEK